MRHPNEGVLRQLLDEPAGVADSDRRHVADCSLCLDGLAAAREDSLLVAAAMTTEGAEGVDVAAGWRRLSTAAAAPATTSTAADITPMAPARARRSRALVRRPAAAAIAAALVLTGASAAAANDWLRIFQTKQIAPISITAADLVALPDLSAYGDLELTGDPDVHEVADARAAAAATGLDVPKVATLPRGISGEPVYQVGSKVSATFTFSVDRAARAAAAAGRTLPPPPPGMDGAQVRLDAGPGVAAVWTTPNGVPALVVGRAVAPTAFSTGVPFETVRDYMLSLPGLPQNVASQLRSFTADGSTLPLPVPADQMTTSTADVNGASATVIATRDKTLAAVVWVHDGVVTMVAGPLDSGEVLSVARRLR